MRQLIQNLKTGKLSLDDVPTPVLKRGGVLVRNHFSLISAGTDKLMIGLAQKSLAGKAKERPDLVKQVIDKAKRDGIINTFQQVMSRLDSPMPLGYSCAGIVEDVGAEANEFKIGDRVACAGAGYANHAEIVFVPKNLCVKIPENLDFESAAFVTIGAISLQGVRRAELTLGERVAVIGLGLLGQITIQLVKAAGCKVLGIDLEQEKVSLAEKLGADYGIARGSNVQEACEEFSKGVGMDAVIITAATTSNDPIELAGEIARDKGRIVVVGAVKMDVPRKTYYEKELDLRLSRSYGPGRYDKLYEEKGVDYPIGYVRWTEKRNMEEFLSLIACGKVTPRPIITHTFDFEDALKAYDLILGKTQEKYLGVLLRYNQDAKLESKVFLREEVEHAAPLHGISLHSTGLLEGKEVEHAAGLLEGREGWQDGRTKEEIQIGLIGAGNFAKGVLLPNLKKIDGVILKAIATATGLSAKDAGEKFGCKYVTSDYQEIISDETIDALIVATRHNLHSRIVVEALQAGKAVFVEKPLALSQEELENVINACCSVVRGFNPRTTGTPNNGRRSRSWTESSGFNPERTGRVMVGFNRRFSSYAVSIHEFFSNARSHPENRERSAPLCITYRVNAGFVPKDSWIQDPEEGGGRIIGEVCHFVDFLQYITNSQPMRVFAERIADSDNILITINFKDGSLGNIGYFANGDKSFPKERVEIFGNDSVAVIDDFNRGEIITKGKRKKLNGKFLGGQDKGHRAELEAFVQAVKSGDEIPIPFQEIIMTTLTTFKIIESISKGAPVEIPSVIVALNSSSGSKLKSVETD